MGENERKASFFQRATMEERGEKNLLKNLGNHWGRNPLNRSPEKVTVGGVREPGLGAGLGWPVGWPPSRAGRPRSRVGTPD